MNSIIRKELAQFFSSLTGYLVISLFLIANGLFLFVLTDSNILDSGYATLERFFDLAPWVLSFLIPAIAMRSFSEEYKTGTFETLKTRPVTSIQIAWGKYCAIMIVLLLAIMPTFTYIITIKMLSTTGNIDSGGIAGSYIGLFFLAAAFAAISVCCSSFTNNAVVAFLASMFACVVFYFGFQAVSKLPVFSGGADYYIDMIGMDFHYRSMSRGVLDTRDIIYFLSVILLGIYITINNIKKYRA